MQAFDWLVCPKLSNNQELLVICSICYTSRVYHWLHLLQNLKSDNVYNRLCIISSKYIHMMLIAYLMQRKVFHPNLCFDQPCFLEVDILDLCRVGQHQMVFVKLLMPHPIWQIHLLKNNHHLKLGPQKSRV